MEKVFVFWEPKRLACSALGQAAGDRCAGAVRLLRAGPSRRSRRCHAARATPSRGGSSIFPSPTHELPPCSQRLAHGPRRDFDRRRFGHRRGDGAPIAAEGGRVFVTDLDGEGAAAVASEIVARGGNAWSASLDVADEAAVEGVVAAARKGDGQSRSGRRERRSVLLCRAGGDACGRVGTGVACQHRGRPTTFFRSSLPAIRESGNGVLLATESLASSHGSAGPVRIAPPSSLLPGSSNRLRRRRGERGSGL